MLHQSKSTGLRLGCSSTFTFFLSSGGSKRKFLHELRWQIDLGNLILLRWAGGGNSPSKKQEQLIKHMKSRCFLAVSTMDWLSLIQFSRVFAKLAVYYTGNTCKKQVNVDIFKIEWYQELPAVLSYSADTQGRNLLGIKSIRK